jgi:hypothetical protein
MPERMVEVHLTASISLDAFNRNREKFNSHLKNSGAGQMKVI